MPRFFCDNISENVAIITGDDAKHIGRVLRMKPGDTLIISDMKGYDYCCQISSLDINNVTLSILNRYKNETEPDIKITLYQALPKGDKLDFIVQKAVELGVSEIVPVLTKRCVARLDSEHFKKKVPRLQRISLEAAKQCGRGIIPIVSNILNFDTALHKMAQNPAIVFYEGGGEKVSKLLSPDTKNVSVFIGSEGGFEESEIVNLREAGIKCATLGRRVLRCETAPVSALTLILNAVGEM